MKTPEPIPDVPEQKEAEKPLVVAPDTVKDVKDQVAVLLNDEKEVVRQPARVALAQLSQKIEVPDDITVPRAYVA